MFATAMDSLKVEQIQEFMEESIKGLVALWCVDCPVNGCCLCFPGLMQATVRD